MKKILTISLLILFAFTSVVFADPPQGRGYNKNKGHESHQGQSYKGHPNSYNDYHGRPGYRSEPYNRRPHHDYYQRYPNHRYHGHWNSWDHWNSYYSRYPEFRRHGHYERHNGQLFFFFNDGLNAFGFSIGGAW